MNITDVIKLMKLTDVLQRGEHMAFAGVSGSHAYGTDHDDSDIDIRGCFLAQPYAFWGLRSPSQQYVYESPDITIFEAAKFLNLALQGNPNVLEVMFLNDYVHMSNEGNILLGLKREVLSEQAIKRYMGFAVGQQKKFLNSKDNKYERRRKKLVLHMFRLLEQGYRLKTEGWVYVRTQQRDRLFELSESSEEVVLAEFERDMSKFKNADSVLYKNPNIDAVQECIMDVRRSML